MIAIKWLLLPFATYSMLYESFKLKVAKFPASGELHFSRAKHAFKFYFEADTAHRVHSH